jgi:hypothetical protein
MKKKLFFLNLLFLVGGCIAPLYGYAEAESEKKRFAEQEPIDEVSQKSLIGTWNEDDIELLRFLGPKLGMSKEVIEEKIRTLSKSYKSEPNKRAIVCESDHIKFTLYTAVCGSTTIIKMKNRFFRLSHEMGAVPLIRAQ